MQTQSQAPATSTESTGPADFDSLLKPVELAFDGGDGDSAAPAQSQAIPSGEQIVADAAAPADTAAPAPTAPPPPPPSAPSGIESLVGALQQQVAWQAQQAQQMPQMIAAAVAQALGQVIPKPEQKAVDPYEGLDQNDPDYHYHKLQRDHAAALKRIEDLSGKFQSWEQKQEQARAEAAQRAQAEEHAKWVSSEVERGAALLFKDIPDSPAKEQLFRMACETLDRNWWQSQYSQQGYTQGWVAAKAALEPLLPFLKTQSAAPKAGAPTAAPLLSSKPQPATMPAAATNGEYWERFDQSRPNDAARLAAALAHAAS